MMAIRGEQEDDSQSEMNELELSILKAAKCISRRDALYAEWECAHQMYIDGWRFYIADAEAPLERAERFLVEAEGELERRRDQLARSKPSDPLRPFFAERVAQAERDLRYITWLVDGERMHEELLRSELDSRRREGRDLLHEFNEADKLADAAVSQRGGGP
jgi:hypothetical protein